MIVMAIMSMLASLLVPSLHKLSVRTRIVMAKDQMRSLTGAMSAYETDYSHLPVSSAVANANSFDQSDFTFGTAGTSTPVKIENTPANSNDYEANNSELVAILQDLVHFRNGTPTLNTDHAFNPRHRQFLVTNYGAMGAVDAAGVYRDPWGNPYIVTVDANHDGYCRDAFYGLAAVSQRNGNSGYNGLHNYTGAPDAFEVNTSVMIWSFGPDGIADASLKATHNRPNTTVGNADNVLSWK